MPTEPLPNWIVDLRRHTGARIRDLRIARRLSQERLGEASGLDRRTISLIERGEMSPTLDSLIRITTALGVPLRSLFE